MAEGELNRVPDGEALRVLGNGLTILRRRKHEYSPQLDDASPERVRELTGKVWGSKFTRDWPLDSLVSWIEERIGQAGWELQPGHRQTMEVRLDGVVGLVAGDPVHTIRIVSDGSYVHAYPVRDRP